ncbi:MULTISPECIES: DUF2303 family protein [unclassified Duganella]|uniref:DUF2303 family protein n=1 Tax=unclassified Duganella TaxID=2636909 RepID=UPI000886AD49|nr:MULTISPECIES: DUF2303 family protein [unclassified Duganella]SDH41853.1 Uncharacterized conserved protein YfdQ, DUF2303 family [Duganella sp. OV458]SDK60547.1 Uncharacterized conserved protein YfdQ, DUF2303 family [Duganella sp. OV510]
MIDQNQPGATEGTAVTTIPAEHAHFDASTLSKMLAMAAASNAVIAVDGITHLLVPDGYKNVDLTAAIDAARLSPARKKGTVYLSDQDSFLTYVKEQGSPATTRIFADVDTRTLTAIFNDHGNVGAGDGAGWRDHRAVFTAALSKEYETWAANDGKAMDQEAFAIHLEDNIADVVEPSGDKLLLVALSLQAKNEVNFNSARRLDNGQVQLEYTENLTTSAGGAAAMEVPRTFAIGARLFKGGEGYRINARLKLRVGGGKVKFWYELDRPHLALEEAFKGYVQQVRGAGSYTVLHGKA